MPDHPPLNPSSLATLAQLRAGALRGATRLDLRNCGLRQLPPEVLALADSLEDLDLSGNALDALPDALAACQRLHTVFASHNRFSQLPPVLGRLPQLDTLGFKANQIGHVPAEALAPTLRWLILTDNRIPALPDSLLRCNRLQKLMLAGNRLSRLPLGMGALQRLELLRLSANHFTRVADALPLDLLTLPRLAWLAHAGNAYNRPQEQQAEARADGLAIDWSALRLEGLLGEGASGVIHAAQWQPVGAPAQAVAVKLFKGAVTSDGLPDSERAASLAAGDHPQLVGALGRVHGHPAGAQGLVLRRVPPQFQPLAAPPSMASCSRDVYAPGQRFSTAQAQAIAAAAGAALAHLHARGLSHGDLYGHNLLVDGAGGALLGDLGAASFLPADDPARAEALRALDARALAVLRDELAQRCDEPAAWQPGHARA